MQTLLHKLIEQFKSSIQVNVNILPVRPDQFIAPLMTKPDNHGIFLFDRKNILAQDAPHIWDLIAFVVDDPPLITIIVHRLTGFVLQVGGRCEGLLQVYL